MRRWISRLLAGGWAVWFFAPAPLAAATVSTQSVYTGMCDASGAVALDAGHFAVADDEANVIRIYRTEPAGPPAQAFDLSAFLQVDPRKPETDLEAACWLGDKVFWIGSHGRNRAGKFRPNRDFLFAISFRKTASGFQLVPEGQPYHHLLDDLLRDPRLQPFQLAEGSERAPKLPGAVNIEGLAGTPDGHLLIGFRNPVPAGRALLVPLLNPTDILAGAEAKLGDPLLLDLGGRGVRDIARWHDGYLIAAGPAGSVGDFVVYAWAGGAAKPRRIKDVRLKHFHAEAIVVYPDRPRSFQLLSDDGRHGIGGQPRPKPDPDQQRFRSLWIGLDAAEVRKLTRAAP